MNAAWTTWWRARTPRERRLLQIAAILAFVLILPGWVYASAANYRAAAADELAAASALSNDVSRLGEEMAAQRASFVSAEGSARERALAAAQEGALTVSRFESAGADRVRVVFEAANSVALYRWVEAMGQRRVTVLRSAITRIGGSDQVNAEFEIAEAP